MTGRSPQAIIELAFASEPGGRGVIAIPHLIGAGSPWWCAEARGAIVNLGPGHGLEDVARAVVEAIALEIRANVDVVEELTHATELLAVNGGLLGDARVAGLLAAAIGLPLIAYSDGSAPARGVAAVAAAATGVATLEELLRADPGTRHEPDPGLAARYDELLADRPRAVGDAVRALAATGPRPGGAVAPSTPA